MGPDPVFFRFCFSALDLCLQFLLLLYRLGELLAELVCLALPKPLRVAVRTIELLTSIAQGSSQARLHRKGGGPQAGQLVITIPLIEVTCSPAPNSVLPLFARTSVCLQNTRLEAKMQKDIYLPRFLPRRFLSPNFLNTGIGRSSRML